MKVMKGSRVFILDFICLCRSCTLPKCLDKLHSLAFRPQPLFLAYVELVRRSPLTIDASSGWIIPGAAGAGSEPAFGRGPSISSVYSARLCSGSSFPSHLRIIGLSSRDRLHTSSKPESSAWMQLIGGTFFCACFGFFFQLLISLPGLLQ